MLSSSKAMKELTEEQQNLQKELESLQNEHAQKMKEFYVEQKDLEKKLEQVMKQKCTCDSNLEKDNEAEYAAQVRIIQFVYCCPFNVEIEAVPFSVKDFFFFVKFIGISKLKILFKNTILCGINQDDFFTLIYFLKLLLGFCSVVAKIDNF